MAIKNDFSVFPYSKVIRHVSGTTVYTVQAFYSWLMDLFDEPAYMSYQTPMKYNTPELYTMLNGWFLDNGDGSNILQFLTGGSINTSGYSTVSDPVLMMDLVDASPAAFIAGDKDLTVYNTDQTENIGPLLAYKNNYPVANSARIWIRNTEGATTPTSNDGIEVTTAGGTGDYTDNSGGAAVSGDEVYANIYTIADFPTNPSPQVYIFQNHPVSGTPTRIGEWSNYTNWDRGSIDILVPVKLGGSAIDSGNLTIFARQTGDTFTHTVSQVSTTDPSRTPISAETRADTVNITTGEWYLFYDGATSPTFTVGDVIQDVSTTGGVVPSWYAEVVSHTAWDTATGYLVLRGLRGDIGDGENIFVGTSDTTADTNGTPGDTLILYDASDGVDPGAGDIGLPVEGSSSGAQRVVRGVQHDNPGGKLCCQVYHTHGALDGQDYTGSGRDVLYRGFTAADVLAAPGGGSATMTAVGLSAVSTTLISGFSDITVAFINGTATIGAVSGGPFTIGEVVNWDSGSSHGIVVSIEDGVDITLANVSSPDTLNGDTITGEMSGATCTAGSDLTDGNTENFAHALSTAYPYSVFIEGGSIYETGRSLADIYAYLQYLVSDGHSSTFYTSPAGTAIVEVQQQAYIKPVTAYGAEKATPFGSLAGVNFFGARGIWLQGMDSTDANNIKLLDHNNELRVPLTNITISITNTRVGDRILIYPEDGSTGLPDLDQYTSHVTLNTIGRSYWDQDDAGGGFPNDTPAAGAFFVTCTSGVYINSEHRYRYVSWANTGGDGDDGRFTLPTVTSGLLTSGVAVDIISDSTKNFVSDSNIEVGDMIYNQSDPAWGYVVSKDDAHNMTTTIMYDANGDAVDWENGDSYLINTLIQTYNTDATFYVAYLDAIEDVGTDGVPGSQSSDVVYAEDRSVGIRVRNVGGVQAMQAFTVTNDITIAGMSQAVIRNDDEVYS